MQVNVQTQHVILPPGANEAISRRAERAFRRLNEQIATIDITLRTDKAERPRRSGICQLKIDLVQGGQVLVIERRNRLRSALGAALKNGRRLLAREYRRRRWNRRRAHYAANRFIEPVAVLRGRHT